MNVALFVDAGRAVPENKFRLRDVSAKHRDRVGADVDDELVFRDLFWFFHLGLPALIFYRHVDGREESRIGKNVFTRKLFRYERAANRETARLEDIIRQSASDEEMIVFLQEEFDERRFCFEFRTAEDSKRGMSWRARLVD